MLGGGMGSSSCQASCPTGNQQICSGMMDCPMGERCIGAIGGGVGVCAGGMRDGGRTFDAGGRD
jgi:hypothetical protein